MDRATRNIIVVLVIFALLAFFVAKILIITT
jgi:hypothetical protein